MSMCIARSWGVQGGVLPSSHANPSAQLIPQRGEPCHTQTQSKGEGKKINMTPGMNHSARLCGKQAIMFAKGTRCVGGWGGIVQFDAPHKACQRGRCARPLTAGSCTRVCRKACTSVCRKAKKMVVLLQKAENLFWRTVRPCHVGWIHGVDTCAYWQRPLMVLHPRMSSKQLDSVWLALTQQDHENGSCERLACIDAAGVKPASASERVISRKRYTRDRRWHEPMAGPALPTAHSVP